MSALSNKMLNMFQPNSAKQTEQYGLNPFKRFNQAKTGGDRLKAIALAIASIGEMASSMGGTPIKENGGTISYGNN